MIDERYFIQGINNKNEEAYRELFFSYFEPLCHHVNRITNDSVSHVDIVQELFINLWHSDYQFANLKALSTWLYRSAGNNSLKFLRDKTIRYRRIEKWCKNHQDDTELPHYELSSIIEEEVLRELRLWIDRLPTERKRIILLALEGLSNQEIADRLGITLATVKNQKFKAYAFIKNHMSLPQLLAITILN